MDQPRAALTDPIARAVARAHDILPDQGPIGVFIHHNTLHAFQHLPFHEGVQAGARELGARPYPPLDAFQRHFRRGRIAAEDVAAAIDDALGATAAESLPLGITRRALWRMLMVEPIDLTDAAGFSYQLQHGDAVVDADRPLWDAALARVHP